ncbi:hypothetical protein N7517_001510 [Penicillium concentricum]|uniref:Uncharacterized protein n=1 Tax=Penicillium concentricum TaxID=293559 RepID=A0A9W9SU59_9EURO|nr:uncharacterized protein N7517_001510 [Penicillium concentricum]KAJ5383599.1 hypothetical protein N7517_001510 [Penicillium concentricum]
MCGVSSIRAELILDGPEQLPPCQVLWFYSGLAEVASLRSDMIAGNAQEIFDSKHMELTSSPNLSNFERG